jgi:hypothetical protein
MVPALSGLHEGPAITRARPGVVAVDSLTSGQGSDWRYYGDVVDQVSRATAGVRQTAFYSHTEGPGGLDLGVRAVAANAWSGYFAVSPFIRAEEFHVKVSLPIRTTPSNYFDAGIWIQTSLPQINTVFCGAVVNATSYRWVIETTIGNARSAVNFTTLYSDAGGPLTRDCIIVTNGIDTLRAYLDGNLVYSSGSLDLRIGSPVQTYLEVQTSCGDAMIHATFSDYYATSNGIITLLSAPPGDRAAIIDQNGKSVASTIVARNGTASFDFERAHQPISGKLQLIDPKNVTVASTEGFGSIWGGSVYTAGQAPPSTASLTVQSITPSGESVPGLWVQVWDENNNLVGSGYTPQTFTDLAIGHSYRVAVQDYGSAHFLMWDDGTTSRLRLFQISNDMAVSAYYQTG